MANENSAEPTLAQEKQPMPAHKRNNQTTHVQFIWRGKNNHKRETTRLFRMHCSPIRKKVAKLAATNLFSPAAAVPRCHPGIQVNPRHHCPVQPARHPTTAATASSFRHRCRAQTSWTLLPSRSPGLPAPSLPCTDGKAHYTIEYVRLSPCC